MSDNKTVLQDWRRGCGGYSFTRQMVRHPLFAQIVERGKAILPDIFQAYEASAWIGWSVALGTITKDRPALPEAAVQSVAPGMVGWDVRRLRDAWMAWGREHGYVYGAASEAARAGDGGE